jgi:hypothetical protein
MRRYQLFAAIMGLILLAGLSGVEGQYVPQQVEAIGQPTPTETVRYPATHQIAVISSSLWLIRNINPVPHITKEILYGSKDQIALGAACSSSSGRACNAFSEVSQWWERVHQRYAS